jgi:uncharacterized membrane protein YphA (DoxX/SURF4 family)
MNIAILIVQVLLAIVFFMAGIMKIIQPKEKLANNMAWVEGFSQNQIRLIGAIEVMGAIGLVLPALTGILPWLTPLAAVGLAFLMVGAVITHMRRGEYPNVITNIVLLALTAFVAYSLFLVLPL